MRNSAFSSHNADNMSWKSGLSNEFSFERPCVSSQLPHHTKSLGGRGIVQISLLFMTSYFSDPNRFHKPRFPAKSRHNSYTISDQNLTEWFLFGYSLTSMFPSVFPRATYRVVVCSPMLFFNLNLCSPIHTCLNHSWVYFPESSTILMDYQTEPSDHILGIVLALPGDRRWWPWRDS